MAPINSGEARKASIRFQKLPHKEKRNNTPIKIPYGILIIEYLFFGLKYQLNIFFNYKTLLSFVAMTNNYWPVT